MVRVAVLKAEGDQQFAGRKSGATGTNSRGGQATGGGGLRNLARDGPRAYGCRNRDPRLFAAHQSRARVDGVVLPAGRVPGADAAGVRSRPAVPAHFESEPESGGGGARRQRRGAIRARQGSRYAAAIGPGSAGCGIGRTACDDLAGAVGDREPAVLVPRPGDHRSVSVPRDTRC